MLLPVIDHGKGKAIALAENVQRYGGIELDNHRGLPC